MKRILYLLILFSGVINAQIVNIPDANFKAKLLSANSGNSVASIDEPYLEGSFWYVDNHSRIDLNLDGEIQVSEAQQIKWLEIRNADIQDLTGIEFFTNLEYLDLYNNLIVDLDVNSLTSLKVLYCNYNLLTSLNVTDNNNLLDLRCQANELTNINLVGLENLEILLCNSNQLISLDVSSLSNLKVLDCNLNQLSTMDFSDLFFIEEIKCQNNFLQSLDFSDLSNLRVLYCNFNQLTSLNVDNCLSLQLLRCDQNQLQSVDVSTCLNLSSIDCSGNQLDYLNIKNSNSNPMELYFYNNSNIQYICSDDDDIQMVEQRIDFYGYTSFCHVNSYCNFTPGGNFNTIVGQIQFDEDNNGCDVNDGGFPNVRINITDGTETGASFSNVNGGYIFFTQELNHELSVATENPTWFTVSPALASVSFTDINNNQTLQNFCISANGVHPDLEIVITPINPARPGFDATYKIVYRNKGNQTLSQQYGVNFFYNQNLMEYVSASLAPSQMVAGGISWDYANLQPFESREIVFTLNINAPTDTNPVNNDDVLVFTTSIMPQAGDENTSDNTFVLNQVVVGSYDPNDITCLEGDVVSPTEIGEYLHYNIRFENTGTAEAENIVVKIEINPEDFDISSLQLLNTSHGVDARIRENIVEFIFQGIYLDTGGHGNVLLKVKTKSNLLTGDLVKNKANIYFDYNFPIITNEAETVFQTLSNPDFEIDKSVKIYPNPTSSIVNISGDFNIKSIQLFDVQGRLLQTSLSNDTNTTLDLTQKAKGMYFIKVISEAGIKVEKIIKK